MLALQDFCGCLLHSKLHLVSVVSGTSSVSGSLCRILKCSITDLYSFFLAASLHPIGRKTKPLFDRVELDFVFRFLFFPQELLRKGPNPVYPWFLGDLSSNQRYPAFGVRGDRGGSRGARCSESSCTCLKLGYTGIIYIQIRRLNGFSVNNVDLTCFNMF